MKMLFINLEDSLGTPRPGDTSPSPPVKASSEKIERALDLPEENTIDVLPQEIKREIVPQTLNEKKSAVATPEQNMRKQRTSSLALEPRVSRYPIHREESVRPEYRSIE